MRKTILSFATAAAIGLPLAAGAQGTDTAGMTEAERAAFREEVRAYLLDNPEIIIEALDVLEKRRLANQVETDRQIVEANSEILFADGFSYVAGNPDGDITVVEFIDYQCGYCKRAHPEVVEMLERDENVRLVVKEFPILGPESVRAGRMALAAMDLDAEKFPALHEALITFDGRLSEAASYQMAAAAGYDIEALKARAESEEISDRLNRNYQIAQALGLEGTPAFVIGGRVERGYLPVDRMIALLADERALSD